MHKTAGKRKVETAFEPVAPIEHEEVVLVQPSFGDRKGKPERLAADTAKPKIRRTETTGESPGKPKAKTIGFPSQKSELPGEPNLRSQLRHDPESPILPVEATTSLSKTGIPNQINASDAESVLERNEPTREQTVFVEPPKIRGEFKPQKAEMHTASLRTKNADKVISETQTLGQESDKRYFTRTAHLIDGQEVAPEEARTILFHEIQEWVAAGASSDAEILSRIDAGKPEAKETQESVKKVEPEPSVVRIREKSVEENVASAAPRQSTDIKEQDFNLSIGTISVVIEGEDRPVQPPAAAVRQQPATQNSHNNAGDRFSRLSRSYL